MRIQTSTIALLAGFSVTVLSACTPYDAGLGENVKHNMAVQVINPDPQYTGDPMEGSSGDRAAAAAERYRKGTVKEPVSIRTSTIFGSSGGSGGGTSSGSGSK